MPYPTNKIHLPVLWARKSSPAQIDAAPIPFYRTIPMTLYRHYWGLVQCRHNNWCQTIPARTEPPNGHFRFSFPALAENSTGLLRCRTCFSLSGKAWASSARRDKLKHVLPNNSAVVSVARDCPEGGSPLKRYAKPSMPIQHGARQEKLPRISSSREFAFSWTGPATRLRRSNWAGVSRLPGLW
jgi:hypothetical protein